MFFFFLSIVFLFLHLSHCWGSSYKILKYVTTNSFHFRHPAMAGIRTVPIVEGECVLAAPRTYLGHYLLLCMLHSWLVYYINLAGMSCICHDIVHTYTHNLVLLDVDFGSGGGLLS